LFFAGRKETYNLHDFPSKPIMMAGFLTLPTVAPMIVGDKSLFLVKLCKKKTAHITHVD
jgi:hypothetical protein